MNNNTARKIVPKITTVVTKTYYVEIDGWIYGGPFETIEEARECLKQAQKCERFTL
jgi:hypothetical protein